MTATATPLAPEATPAVPERPRRARSVVVQPGPEGADHDLVVVEDDGRYLRVGRPQARLLDELDGTRTVDELAALHRLPPDALRPLIARFAALGVVVDADADETPTHDARRRVRHHEAGRVEFRLVDPDRWLGRLVPVVRPLLRGALLPVVGVLIALAMLAAGVAVSRDHPDVALAFRPLPMVALTVAVLITIALHELGHALAVAVNGGRVRRMGVMVYYLVPGMFCDTSDSWRFPAREQRVMVAAAGLLVQLTLTALVLQLLWLPVPETLQAGLLVYGGANLGLSAYNLLPLVKLDGYWMLVSGLDRSGLRERAMETAAGWWRWPALGDRRPAVAPEPVALALFGVACAVAGPALVLYALWRYGGYLIDLDALGASLWLLALVLVLWKPAAGALRRFVGLSGVHRARVALVSVVLLALLVAVVVVVDGTGDDAIAVRAYHERLRPAWDACWSWL